MFQENSERSRQFDTLRGGGRGGCRDVCCEAQVWTFWSTMEKCMLAEVVLNLGDTYSWWYPPLEVDEGIQFLSF